MLIVEPAQVLEKLSGFPLRAFERGDVILSEGSDTHRLLFLNRGAVDVVKDEVQLTRVTEPGAVFGDMSVLLGQPHSADVLAASRAASTSSTTPKASCAEPLWRSTSRPSWRAAWTR